MVRGDDNSMKKATRSLFFLLLVMTGRGTIPGVDDGLDLSAKFDRDEILSFPGELPPKGYRIPESAYEWLDKPNYGMTPELARKLKAAGLAR